MRAGLLLVTLVACSSSKYEPPPPPPEPSPLDQVHQYLASDPPDMFMVGAALSDAGSAAPKAADALIAAWPRIEAQELVLAKRAGTERGQGKSPQNCRECRIFGEAMDKLAPHEPRLATAWTQLKPKLAAAEEAAYQVEASDKRPRVIIWADMKNDGSSADIVVDCITDALKKAYPDHKWLNEWARPDRGVASIEIVAAVTTDDYTDSRTHEHAVSLASGLKVGLVPSALPAELAIHPFEVSVSVSSPDEIRSDLNVTPTLEATRAGTDQLHELRSKACAKVISALKDRR